MADPGTDEEPVEFTGEQIARLGHWISECLDDAAPLHERRWARDMAWMVKGPTFQAVMQEVVAAARADEREQWEDERDHLLAPFAALAEEYETTTNPAPYTSERALWERFSSILAPALAQPADTEGGG